jgi:hypothetical protein
MTARAEDFERHRSLLFSIAYRMLSSGADGRIRSVRMVVSPGKLRLMPPYSPSR